MSDIVERLRELAACEVELAHDCDMRPQDTANWEYSQWLNEAADEIERLRGLLREARDIVGIGAPYQRNLNARIDAFLTHDIAGQSHDVVTTAARETDVEVTP